MSRIDELEKLLTEATPGPWHYPGTKIISVPQRDIAWQPNTRGLLSNDGIWGSDEFSADAHLIVNAVNALPALLTGVRLLRDWCELCERTEWNEANSIGDLLVRSQNALLALEES